MLWARVGRDTFIMIGYSVRFNSKVHKSTMGSGFFKYISNPRKNYLFANEEEKSIGQRLNF